MVLCKWITQCTPQLLATPAIGALDYREMQLGPVKQMEHGQAPLRNAEVS